MVSFAEPVYLWLLALPTLAALGAVLRHQRRRFQQRRLASPAVWLRLMGGTPASGLVRMLMWSLAAALLVLAVARPQWGELPVETSVRTRDLVIAIDVSDSMRCQDVSPSRLGKAVQTLTRLLPRLDGNRIGVVVFAGAAYPLVPLTSDLQAVSVFLQGVEPGTVSPPGSNLENAVAAALELLPAEGEGRVMVLLTDGENLQGNIDAAAQALARTEVPLIGGIVGTAQGGPIPIPENDGKVHYKRDGNGQPVVTRAQPGVLGQLVEMTQGELVQLEGPDPAIGISEVVETIRTRQEQESRTVRRVERFPIFLASAALFAAVGFVLSPWRRLSAALVTLVMMSSVSFAQEQPSVTEQASNVQQAATAANDAVRPSWWQRLLPGGSRRLARRGTSHWKNEAFPEATQAFAGAAVLNKEDPSRLYDLGTSLAVVGDLESAEHILAGAHERGAESAAYNLGTAGLKQQQPELALPWLRRALLANSSDPDAKRNYELALQLMQEQEQDQQDQQEQEDESSPQPTPTPQPSSEGGPPPTPTPGPQQSVFAALDRAEAEARKAMASPTPKSGKVEKDW
ncbi:MAG: VWA domain-containing protein [bacterium]|nr:VWA domain-containing protein [bacterium]